jgi:hypothetical protein
VSVGVQAIATVELTTDAMDGVCTDIGAGVPLKTALLAHDIEPTFIEAVCAVGAGKRVAGFSPSEELQEQVGGFLRRVRTAQAKVAAESAKSILEAGQTVGKNGVKEWRALAWWLNNSEQTRKDWYEHRSQQIDVQQHGALSEEARVVEELWSSGAAGRRQVLEMAGPEFAALVSPDALQQANG